VAPRESTAGEIEGGHLICFLGVVDPVEDPESLDLARDREVLERGLEGSAVEWLRASSVRRSPEPVEGAEEVLGGLLWLSLRTPGSMVSALCCSVHGTWGFVF
jgi:hypothetical protein